MKRERTIEVLAPAGSYESLKAAVNAGADAVYMGGARFGARAYAESTGEDMLLPSLEYAHLHGRKLYLTVNTLLKEQELARSLYEYLVPAYEAGVDALIVQDLGVWNYVRRNFPDIPLHASTQMTITGVPGAKMAKELGAARIVTARELSIKEIRRIHEQVDVEIETFVHGALCYCYSGQCLYSSLIGGRSGNRGRCAQPCRLPYEVWEDGKRRRTDGSYVMNLKDLCGLDSLGELLSAGVDSLKIEGRMKSPRYTAGVVSVYRRYVDLYKAHGGKALKAAASDKEFLLELFDRGGFSDGYFHVHNGKHMVAMPEKPSFRQVNSILLETLDKSYMETEIKEKIKGKLRIAQDLPAKLSLTYNSLTVTAEGETVLPAKSRPLTESDLKKQMEKLGGTPFEWAKLEIFLAGDCFLPVKALNELRRTATEKLKEAVLESYRRTLPEKRKEREDTGRKAPKGQETTEKPCLSVLADTGGQLLSALEFSSVKRIYLSMALVPWEQIAVLGKQCKAAGKEFFLALPPVYRSDTEVMLKEKEPFWRVGEVDGWLLRVLDETGLMERPGGGYSYVADHSLYTFNREARAVYREMGIEMDTAPLELNERELRDRGLSGSEIVVYGRLPMMVSAQCIRRTSGGCDRKPSVLYMADRKKKRFPVKNYCRFCYNMIYNSEPLWLADEIEALSSLGPAYLRLQFTTEGTGEVRSVIGAYERALCGKEPGFQPSAWTRGHFRRGVE